MIHGAPGWLSQWSSCSVIHCCRSLQNRTSYFCNHGNVNLGVNPAQYLRAHMGGDKSSHMHTIIMATSLLCSPVRLRLANLACVWSGQKRFSTLYTPDTVPAPGIYYFTRVFLHNLDFSTVHRPYQQVKSRRKYTKCSERVPSRGSVCTYVYQCYDT